MSIGRLESTVTGGFPSPRAGNAELWCFLSLFVIPNKVLNERSSFRWFEIPYTDSNGIVAINVAALLCCINAWFRGISGTNASFKSSAMILSHIHTNVKSIIQELDILLSRIQYLYYTKVLLSDNTHSITVTYKQIDIKLNWTPMQWNKSINCIKQWVNKKYVLAEQKCINCLNEHNKQ